MTRPAMDPMTQKKYLFMFLDIAKLNLCGRM